MMLYLIRVNSTHRPVKVEVVLCYKSYYHIMILWQEIKKTKKQNRISYDFYQVKVKQHLKWKLFIIIIFRFFLFRQILSTGGNQIFRKFKVIVFKVNIISFTISQASNPFRYIYD